MREALGDNEAAASEEPGGPQSTPVTAEVPSSTDGAPTERAARQSATSSCLEGRSPAWKEGRGGIADLSDG